MSITSRAALRLSIGLSAGTAVEVEEGAGGMVGLVFGESAGRREVD